MARFNPQGHSKVLLVSTISNAAAPTAAELAAGTDITPFIVPDGITGFTSEPATVDATDLAASREKTVRGLATTTNGAITFYRGDDAGDDEADLFDDLVSYLDTSKYVVFAPSGAITATKLVDVFPVKVASVNASPPTGGQAGRFMVGFTHPAEPSLNVAVAS